MMKTTMPQRIIFISFSLIFIILSGCSTAKKVGSTVGSAVGSVSKNIVYHGNSMEPTFKDGQQLKYESVEPSDLKRGDVILFKTNDSTLIRRLVGLPNESLEIKDGVVYINDQALEEAYILKAEGQSLTKIQLAEDEYFVMGDNRNNNNDSKSFGPVKAKDIVGRMTLTP